MIKTKKSVKDQKYEDYWKLTMEYTDIYDEKFNTTLSIIIDFMDNKGLNNRPMTSPEYQKLTKKIEETYPKNDSASTRKSINQFYKLGFINNNGDGYHKLTKDFLKENNARRKQMLLSRIMYSNASFSRSFSRKSNINEVNFFIKTLENMSNQQMSLDQLMGLITVDISDYELGYITEAELNQETKNAKSSGFMNRKFNQIGYIKQMFSKLEGVYFSSNTFSLTEMDIEETQRKGRDSYLQSIYKSELITESESVYGGTALCYLDKLPHKSFIASHIKPWIKSDEEEKYDVNNGLLLSRSMDALFNYGYISFDEKGKLIFSKELDIRLVNALSTFELDDKIYNVHRQRYMKYHRDNVFRNSI
jgi:putative restriction endonuclease